MMLEDRRRDTKLRFFAEYTVESNVRHRWPCCESRLEPELSGRERVHRLELIHDENEIAAVARDQIPLIAVQLVIDVLCQAGRAIEVNGYLSPDQQP